MPSDQQREGDRQMKERWWEKSESAEESARRVACQELRVVNLQRRKLWSQVELWAGESRVMHELLGHREIFLTKSESFKDHYKCQMPVLCCGDGCGLALGGYLTRLKDVFVG